MMTPRLSTAVWLLLCAALSCATELPGKRPPQDAFYFPINMVVRSVNESTTLAYVLNANFDLRFNTGWIQTVNLEAWAAQPQTAPDGDDQGVAAFGQQLYVPSLGAGMAEDPEGQVIITTHRGSPTLAIIEVTGQGRISCGDPFNKKGIADPELSRTDCDARHLVQLDPDPSISPSGNNNESPLTFLFEDQGGLPAGAVRDPIAATFFQQNVPAQGESPAVLKTFLLVSFVSAGQGTNLALQSPLVVFELDRQALASGTGDILIPNAALRSVLSGVDAVRQHPLSTPEQPLLAGSSRLLSNGVERSTVYRMVFDPAAGAPTFADIDPFRLATFSGGLEIADLVFTPGTGAFAYGANNAPDAIVVFDTSLVQTEVTRQDGETQIAPVPRFAFLDAVALSGRPANLTYMPRTSGDLLIASMFESNDIFLLAVAGAEVTPVARIDNIGDGPISAVALDDANVLVASFFDHALSLLNVPADPLGAAQIRYLRSAKTGVADDQRR